MESGVQKHMAKRLVILFFLGIVISLSLAAASNHACTCGGARGKTMRDIAAWYSEGSSANKFVFEGTVEKQDLVTGPIRGPANAMSMTMSGAYRAVSIRVLQAYQGQASGNMTVLTGMGLGDCGFDFETGKQYVVYADRINAKNLFTSICSGTSQLEHAGPALRFLRGEKPTPDDLLDVQNYNEKFWPQWTGSACGRVTKPDGSPFDKVSIEMTEKRDEPFPPYRSADPDLSKPDGSFCIRYLRPGKYLLTAEKTDYDSYIRWMGYYPGVGAHSEALPIEIHAGDNLSDLRFTVRKQVVYTVSFRIVTPDGKPAPTARLGVSIDSPDQDALSYHLTQNRDEDGYYTVGYVPPGHYVVQTYIIPDFETAKAPEELSRWRMVKQDVDISADSKIVVRLNPAQ